MKNYRTHLSFLFLLLFTLATFAQDFEGKVVMNIQGDGENMDMNYLVKGDKIRIEVEEQENAAIIFDNTTKKMMIIMPDQKMYMEMDMQAMEKMAQNEMNKADDTGDFKMTGETKTISGYECEKWIYTDNGEETVAWMTKDIGNFMMMSNPMMGNEAPEWQQKLSGEGYFPMQVVHKDASGQEDATMTVKSVEKKSLESSLFSAPSGFQKMEMPMMNFDK